MTGGTVASMYVKYFLMYEIVLIVSSDSLSPSKDIQSFDKKNYFFLFFSIMTQGLFFIYDRCSGGVIILSKLELSITPFFLKRPVSYLSCK